MAVLHEKGSPMILGSNRVVLCRLKDLEPLKIHFITALRTLVRTHLTPDLEAGFLCQLIQRVELFRREIPFEGHALYDASSIPEQNELELTATAPVVDPAAKSNFLTFVGGNVFNVNHGHRASL